MFSAHRLLQPFVPKFLKPSSSRVSIAPHGLLVSTRGDTGRNTQDIAKLGPVHTMATKTASSSAAEPNGSVVDEVAQKFNQWEHSPAEYDFRSDTLTTPTPSMLRALTYASLGDDVYRESVTTTNFESFIASLFHKPSALFVLSGTMGNQLALRAHLTQAPHAILCDYRSHINQYEAGGVALLSQAMVQTVVPANNLYLTLEDVMKVAILSDDIHFAQTKVICLENTIHGVPMPIEEVRKISDWAHENGIKIHLDGARLWNACSVDGAPSMQEYASLVDSLQICFSKSLGAPIGSALVGEPALINHARHTRKAVGGGTRQVGILTAMAKVAVDEVFLAGRLKESNTYAKQVEKVWVEELGQKTTLPVMTNMIWIDFEKTTTEAVWKEVSQDYGVKVGGSRFVFHYQNSQKSVDKLCDALREAVKRAKERKVDGVNGFNGSTKSNGIKRGYLDN